ncbi:MAG: hypothetical protein QXK88_02275 [Desulfurococcaceae archaeon]
MSRETARKIYTLPLLAIIAFSLLGIVLPLLQAPVVQAATGNSLLAAVKCSPSGDTLVCTDIKISEENISIKAGEMKVEAVDGDSAYKGWYFAIVLDNVVFSGAKFKLYLDSDPLSQLLGDEIEYTSEISVAPLYTAGLKKITIESPLGGYGFKSGNEATFYIGKATIKGTSYKLLIGPVPFYVAELANYKYIKIYDGYWSEVAVAPQEVEFLPGFAIYPSEGPGGGYVELLGAAIEPSTCFSLTYGSANDTDEPLFDDYYSCADEWGLLYEDFYIKDLKLAWTGKGAIPYKDINIYIWDMTDADPGEGTLVDYVTYREYARSIVELRSELRNDIALKYTDDYTGAGNNTLVVKAYGNHTYDNIILAGGWWNPSATIEVDVEGFDYEEYLEISLDERGFFNVEISLPTEDYPYGLSATNTYLVKIIETVDDEELVYWFNLTVVRPGIKLDPTEGYVGSSVKVTLTEFPANKSAGLWWNTTCSKLLDEEKYIVLDDEWTNLKNVTVGLDGKALTTFTVPADGGLHEVRACSPWDCEDAVVDTSTFEPALFSTDRAFFKILPKMDIVHAVTGLDTFANDGNKVYVVLTGLTPDVFYSVLVDNQLSIHAACDDCGYLNLTLVAAGFRPGLHVVALYKFDLESRTGTVAPEYFKAFAVTCENDPVCSKLDSFNATLVSVSDSIATISTTVGTIKADLSTLKPVISSIQGDVATIKTDVGVIKADVSALKPVVTDIKNDVATVSTTLGELKGKITTIEGNVATIKTDVGVIKADVSSIKESAGAVPGLSTAIWMAVIFSLISALLAAFAVISVRRKIAG